MDILWIAILSTIVLGFIVQTVLQSKFKRYSAISTTSGLTGAEIAKKMLEAHGIYDVKVISVEGQLTDHYNPLNKTVNLSKDVYHNSSIAAAAVAAHECGHAVQHEMGYAPLRLRSALVPVVSFASHTVQWVLLLGIVLLDVFPGLIWGGIVLFACTTLFSFVTLPVEINASRRAIDWLEMSGIATADTRTFAVDALKWAAYTYVIAAISSLITLLYYISIATNNSGRKR